MRACFAGLWGGGPDSPRSPGTAPATPAPEPSGSDALPATPASSAAPRTPALKRQCSLPFAVTPSLGRSGSQSSLPSSPGTPFDTIKAGNIQLAMTPAIQKLHLAKRAHPELAQVLQAVVDEHAQIVSASGSKRMPGQLALKPVNADGARATQPGKERTGRPRDPQGPRVGRQGYLTPDQKSNNRRQEQVVLRRDCPAPARLRMAEAVAREGVTSENDLRSVLPATWTRLEARFARILGGQWDPFVGKARSRRIL